MRVFLAHHIPGRLRLRTGTARPDPASLERILRSVRSIEGVTGVETSPVTGSLLVHYQNWSQDGFRDQLRARGGQDESFLLSLPPVGEAVQPLDPAEGETEFLAEHSRTARAIVDVLSALNQNIKRATDNWLDLNLLWPLGIAVTSVAKAGVEKGTPFWVTLGLFSFNSFIALHPGIRPRSRNRLEPGVAGRGPNGAPSSSE